MGDGWLRAGNESAGDLELSPNQQHVSALTDSGAIIATANISGEHPRPRHGARVCVHSLPDGAILMHACRFAVRPCATCCRCAWRAHCFNAAGQAVLGYGPHADVAYFIYSPEHAPGMLLLSDRITTPTNITITAGNGS